MSQGMELKKNDMQNRELYYYLIFTENCYLEYFTNYNLFDIDCLSKTLSRVLSIFIVGLSLLLKLPQIYKIIKNRKTSGLSCQSLFYENILYSFSIAYNIYKQNSFMLYGESVFILLQNIVISGLFIKFNQNNYRRLVIIFIAINVVLYTNAMSTMLFDFILIINNVLTFFAKLPQIFQNWQNKNTGQLAFITVLLQFGGTVARSFTVLVSCTDLLLIVSKRFQEKQLLVFMFEICTFEWYFIVLDYIILEQQSIIIKRRLIKIIQYIFYIYIQFWSIQRSFQSFKNNIYFIFLIPTQASQYLASNITLLFLYILFPPYIFSVFIGLFFQVSQQEGPQQLTDDQNQQQTQTQQTYVNNLDDNQVLLNQFFTQPDQSKDTQKNKNCKLHIGNLPLNIQEETLSRVFSKYGPIKEIKIIRKNSQGQPLKDYCYGFVLMQDGEGALSAVTELKSNSPLGTTWTVAFSKDKNDDISGASHKQKDEKKKDEKSRKKDKSKDRQKKLKSKKDKKKKKSESSSSSDSSKSRAKSQKKNKKKKKRISSSSDSSSSKLPTRSALVKVEQRAADNNLSEMIFMDPSKLQQQLISPMPQMGQQSTQYQVKHQILVRELFISGIPQNKTNPDIQRIFSQYGIVERVDIIPKQLVNYAYVKFKRLESVIIAIQNSNLIAELLESNGQVKIYNSDPFRRVQIVGNAEDCEKEDEMIPVMFIGYPSNPSYTVDEKHLKKLAEKYGGSVLGIQHVQPDQPQLRSYILIEFHELRDCKKARRKFCRYKIEILGDKKCDVAILSNLPNSLQSKRQQPGIYINPQQQFANPQMQMPYQMMNRNMNPQMMGAQYGNQLPMYGYDNQQQLLYQQQMMQNQLYNQMAPQSLQSIQPPGMIPRQTQQQPQQQIQQQQQNPQYRNQLQQQPALSPPQQQQQTYYQSIPAVNYQQQQPQQSQQLQNMQFNMDFIPQPSKIEDTTNVFWSGFINRGRQHRAGIDAKIISSQIEATRIHLPYNLDMSFKCTYQDALNKYMTQQSAVMIFTPAGENDVPNFTEQIQYLISKSRAGVIQSDEFTIYIIPPGVSEGKQIHNAQPLEMIAIYCCK